MLYTGLHIYFTECLPKKNRGCTMVVITLCGAFGTLLSAGLAWIILPKFGWRWFVGACAVPSCVILIYRLWFSFESPRYLYISGQKERGFEVLKEIAIQSNTRLPKGMVRIRFVLFLGNKNKCMQYQLNNTLSNKSKKKRRNLLNIKRVALNILYITM